MGLPNEKEFNRLKRWMISGRDFQIARSAATFLLEEVDEDEKYSLAELRRFKCYETTMVVAYARPFSMAKGLVGPLGAKEVGMQKGAPFFPMHQKIIQHRNTLYGHSDAEFVEMSTWLVQASEDRAVPFPRFPEHLNFDRSEVNRIHEQTVVFMHLLAKKGAAIGHHFKDRMNIIRMDDDERPA